MASYDKTDAAQSSSNSITTAPSKPVAAAHRELVEDRIMNDTTMPPPKKSLVASFKNMRTNAESVTKPGAPNIPRNKVGRFGLADWTRLLSVANDLAQLKGQPIRKNISWKEIKQHKSPHDGWIVIRGKVYNLTSYIPYHPGGEKILHPTLGRDGTALFDKYHRWVNEDGLIGKLLIGYLDKSSKYDSDDEDDSDDDASPAFQIPSSVVSSSTNIKTPDGFAIPNNILK